MNSAVTTLRATESLKSVLEQFTASVIASAAETNLRTAENWKAGNNGPDWTRVCRMMHHPELGPALLTAMGRDDLANVDQALGKLRSAKRALATLDEATDGIIDIIPALQTDLFGERRPSAPSRAERIGVKARAASLGKAR